MFYPIDKPPQWMLDGLLNEEKKTSSRGCPDCGVKVNKKHTVNCDVARCTVCGGQHLGCDCDNKAPDVWTGLWPGIMDAYKQKLVCFDTATNKVYFDLNEVAIMIARRAPTVVNVADDFWHSLSSMPLNGKYDGNHFRTKYMSHMDNQEFWDGVRSPAIQFDFTGVRKINPSFANDAFAYFTKYANATKVLKTIEFVNITTVKREIINLEVEQGYYGATT